MATIVLSPPDTSIPPPETPRDVIAHIETVWSSLDARQRRKMIASVHGITKSHKRSRYKPGIVADLSWRPKKHVDAVLDGLRLIADADTRIVRRERTAGEAELPCKIMTLELITHAPGTDTGGTLGGTTVSLSMVFTTLLSRLVEQARVLDLDDVGEGVITTHDCKGVVASLGRSRGAGVACDHDGLERLRAAARVMRQRLETVG